MTMNDMILDGLASIEREEEVTIIYACESGSRAWGFPSTDSDYDVRFLYVHPLEWYLSVEVEEKRDVIERPIVDDLDINGWDLRKGLRLLRKSNPPCLEWLGSPIIYSEMPGIVDQIRETARDLFSPIGTAYHYLSMARATAKHLNGTRVPGKKYFYALRPLLAIQWIEERQDIPPVAFDRLLDAVVSDRALRAEIDDLLERKRRGAELDEIERMPSIDRYIRTELERLERGPTARPPAKLPTERLDLIFRRAIEIAR